VGTLSLAAVAKRLDLDEAELLQNLRTVQQHSVRQLVGFELGS